MRRQVARLVFALTRRLYLIGWRLEGGPTIDGTARVHDARDELLAHAAAKAAYDAQKARIDARVVERRADHSDGLAGAPTFHDLDDQSGQLIQVDQAVVDPDLADAPLTKISNDGSDEGGVDIHDPSVRPSETELIDGSPLHAEHLGDGMDHRYCDACRAEQIDGDPHA